MHVVDLDALIEQVVGKVFCHAFSQRRNKDAFFFCATFPDFIDEIVDLTADGSHIDLWV